MNEGTNPFEPLVDVGRLPDGKFEWEERPGPDPDPCTDYQKPSLIQMILVLADGGGWEKLYKIGDWKKWPEYAEKARLI